jgi:hypothetical protein
MVRFDFREVRATQAGSGSSAITALQQAAIYKLILEITFAADATWLSAKRNDRALQIRRHGSRLLAHSIRVPFFFLLYSTPFPLFKAGDTKRGPNPLGFPATVGNMMLVHPVQ